MSRLHDEIQHDLRFQAERWILAHNGKTAIVRLSEPLDDIGALAQHEILIDGCPFRCARMSGPSHAPPFRIGEYLMLLVDTPE
jgi:hypothetical protein